MPIENNSLVNLTNKYQAYGERTCSVSIDITLAVTEAAATAAAGGRVDVVVLVIPSGGEIALHTRKSWPPSSNWFILATASIALWPFSYSI